MKAKLEIVALSNDIVTASNSCGGTYVPEISGGCMGDIADE